MRTMRSGERQQALPGGEPVASRPRAAVLGGKIRAEHLLYVASIMGMVGLWHVIATTLFTPQFFPGPLVVLAPAREMVASRELFAPMGISLQRILTGFVIGSAMAAPAGLLMGSVRTVRALFDPYTQFFRCIPSIAWQTPVVLWFGMGEISKVWIILDTTTFIVLINTMVGVSHIAPNKLRAAACLGATPIQAFLQVTLPATVPFILTGMRLAMGNSFATVRSAEMIAADTGLGFLVVNWRLWMATDTIFIGIVCLYWHCLPGPARPDDRSLLPLHDCPLCASVRADRGERCRRDACHGASGPGHRAARR